MESLFGSLHKVLLRRARVSLWLESDSGGVSYAVDLPDEYRILFLQELQDAYPGTVVTSCKRPQSPSEQESWYQDVRLVPDLLRIRTHEEFIDLADDRLFADPVSGLMASVRSGTSGRVQCSIKLSIRRARPSRIRAAERILRRFGHGFISERLRVQFLKLATDHRFWLRRAATVLFFVARKEPVGDADSPDKCHDNLFECGLTIAATVPIDSRSLARQKLREIAGAFGRFNKGDTVFRWSKPAKRERVRRPFLLTQREVATLWHPITVSGDTVSRLERPAFREVEPPVVLTSKKGTGHGTVLGRVKFRQQRSQFGIAADDLRRHMLAIGKTGCGKSTFLLNIVRQQVESNRGVILVDPHGQLAEEVLNVIPKRRTNDVVYFDASDSIAPVGFNPMKGPLGTDANLIADGVLTSFKNVFGFDDGSAPRLLHIFRNCLLSLIHTRHASLASVQRLLVDANFRKSVVGQVENDAVREFWLTEFNRWNDRDRVQYIASLQNKLGAFTTNQRLQMILNGDRKGIQLREIMDQSKILICNLSKGRVGHDASTLLGSLLLSSLQIAAMSRADTPEADRTDCVCVIDEFHSYLADGNTTMADALAESRKYRTSYVLSTQMLEQLDATTLAGVLGNCGSTLCMTVGPRDAEILAELLGSGLSPEDLMKIPKFHAYLRLLIDGAPHTFSMTTLAPPRYNVGRAEVIRKVSRQRSATTPLS